MLQLAFQFPASKNKPNDDNTVGMKKCSNTDTFNLQMYWEVYYLHFFLKKNKKKKHQLLKQSTSQNTFTNDSANSKGWAGKVGTLAGNKELYDTGITKPEKEKKKRQTAATSKPRPNNVQAVSRHIFIYGTLNIVLHLDRKNTVKSTCPY